MCQSIGSIIIFLTLLRVKDYDMIFFYTARSHYGMVSFHVADLVVNYGIYNTIILVMAVSFVSSNHDLIFYLC